MQMNKGKIGKLLGVLLPTCLISSFGVYSLASCEKSSTGTTYTLSKTDDKYFLIDTSGVLQGFNGGPQGDMDLAFHAKHYKTVILSDFVSTITSEAFYRSVSFRDNDAHITLVFDRNCLSVDAKAFDTCIGIDCFDFSRTRTSFYIGADSFFGCNIKKVIPGNNVQEVPVSGWGSNLHIFANSDFMLTHIIGSTPLNGEGCGCLAYGNIEVASTCSAIGNSAFDGCGGITSVDFSKLTSSITIGQYAFDCCYFTNIIGKSGIIDEEDDASGLHVFTDGTMEDFQLGYTALYLSGCGCLAYGSITGLSLTSGSINNNAFDGCGGITSVTLSDDNTADLNVGVKAFWGCAMIQHYSWGAYKTYKFEQEAFRAGRLSGYIDNSGNATISKTEILNGMVVASYGWMSSLFWSTR